VSKGKLIAIGEAPQCSGKVQVTGTSIAGQYTCSGVTSYDPATGKMAEVNIQIQFTAQS
jgi:hypothetical protein